MWPHPILIHLLLHLSDVDFFLSFLSSMYDPQAGSSYTDVILQILQRCFLCPQKYLLSTIGIQGRGLGS